MPARIQRAVHTDSRRQELLDVAARLFARRGYSATSMRDIAQGVGMLPGSMYCHFESKEALLVAVYEAGVGELAAAVDAALRKPGEPWARLEAACVAHLHTVLKNSDTAQVLIRVMPEDVPEAAARLRLLRAGYERIFRALVAALPLPKGTDRRALRLMLLGALNWARFWYDVHGADSPRVLARRFIGLLRNAQQESSI
jgi:AcrR family transcriptional regulator